MDSLIGFVGADYVLVMSDTSQARSILKMKGNEDKVYALDKYRLMAAAGEQGDRENFTQFIQKNLALYALRTGLPLTTEATANYTRHELAKVRSSFWLLHFWVVSCGVQGDDCSFCRQNSRCPKTVFLVSRAFVRAIHRSWASPILYQALRRNPYQTNLLLGGFDEGVGPSLFYLDYLGSMHKVQAQIDL